MIMQEVDIEALGRVEGSVWGYLVTLERDTHQVLKLEWLHRPIGQSAFLSSTAQCYCFFWRVDHPIRAILKTQKYIEDAGWRNEKE